jgi:hypothetical protein
MAQQYAAEKNELAGIDEVTDVKESCEGGIAYVLICEDYNVQRVRVALLKSDKWSPRDGYRNEVDPSNSYVKVTYTREHFDNPRSA